MPRRYSSGRERVLESRQRPILEEAEEDALHAAGGGGKSARLAGRDPGGPLQRETKDARRDRGKRHGLRPDLLGAFQGGPHGRREERLLAGSSPLPHRPDRVNHPPRGKVSPARDDRSADRAMSNAVAFPLDRRAALP